ncbi:hypothetical protein HMPREF9103_01337 [Lentilactobacillus parafarraginis F0439]|uniref:Uncharacterized protein n=1 Tax=Lentilactobacillus parafarraginis F0439 TaxID=797515 RepID=G9ZNN4_9LACO|nr:hypothetical protein HMPREF9103_01337 [Lentilactobacillus parafarraginis F0439]
MGLPKTIGFVAAPFCFVSFKGVGCFLVTVLYGERLLTTI